MFVDLFAGGGGTSTGLVLASRDIGKTNIGLTAINHNAKALQTHEANFPWARHVLTELQFVDPLEIAPEGRLDGLVASPECTFFSRARGGKPIRPQDRASPWYIGKWITKLDIPWVLIENVPEIVNWGPLQADQKTPVRAKKGTYFRLWKYMFQKAGYSFDYRFLNSANYGDATTRTRFFAIARNDGMPIIWPEPTHSRNPGDGQKEWLSARDHVIDWNLKGTSIFSRKKPLSKNTMDRIIAGLKKFGSKELQPFIVMLEHSQLSPVNRIRSIDIPLPTITGARGGAIALAQPFILPVEGYWKGNQPKSVDNPLGTITQRGYGGIVESFILSQASGGSPRNVSEPVPTIPTAGKHALIQPYLIEYYGRSETASIEDPIPTITTKDKFGLVEPFVKVDGTVYRLEVLYRMLKPHELSQAMGFPVGYKFLGSQQERVKQIGNAVAVNMAKALITSLMMRPRQHPLMEY